MTKALVVARWEYLEKVKSKAFLISLFLTPIIMVAMGVLPGLLAGQEDKSTKIIGVVDLSGKVADEFARRMEQYTLPDGQPNYVVQVLGSGSTVDLASARSDADMLVARDDIEGYLIIGAEYLKDTLVEYRSKNVGDFRVRSRVEENLKNIITERKLAAMGIEASVLRSLKVPLDVKSVKISSKGMEEEGGFLKVFFSAYVFMMMLFFLILTSGQLLVRSVMEEKANRIVEVLVSSSSPTEIMAGKVLGLSALGLTQIFFWGLVGAAVSLHMGVTLVPIDQALLLLVYFVLGYLFYAAVFIMLGSPVTTEQEAQQITGYLVMLLVMPVVLAIPAMQNPNATWLKVLTYVPFLTPTLMALRIPIQMPSLGEVIATVLVMIGSIYGGMWAAGRVFRVAILATGKRPSLAEIIRWVKNG
jgi:ABC-2 type transport system permease protein